MSLETSAKSLVDQVKNAIEHQNPLVIEGGGSKQFYGYPPPDELPRLSTAEHTGVIDYAPDELMMRVRAGTPLSEINQLLRENNQFLAFEPPEFNHKTTIGGVIASGLSGPRRPFAGSVRDFVLGVTLITGSGDVLSFGGQVMKNVAGYDVSRLVTGAMGTLGVILDVSLKVLPAPELERSVVRSVKVEDFQSVMLSIRKNLPLSAVAHENGLLRLRVSGSEIAVEEAMLELGGEETGNEYWDRLNTLTHFTASKELWRVSLKPTSKLYLDEAALIDWGGGLRWMVDPVKDVREILKNEDGHATLVKHQVKEGIPGVEVFQPLGQPLQAIHQRLKSRFDPLGIFNPGRMYQDL
jgi:glycolate oxidase FAD binding subunit